MVRSKEIMLSVNHKDASYTAKLGQVFENPDYADATFTIEDEDIDGVFIVIRPDTKQGTRNRTPTKVMRIIKDAHFEDGYMDGSGTLLVMDKSGHMRVITLNSRIKPRRNTLQEGDTFCYFANPEGLAMVQTTEPHYTPDMEEEIIRSKEGDNLHPSFWIMYDHLLDGSFPATSNLL